MIELLESGSERILAFKLSGKLHDEDYKIFEPAVDAAVARGGPLRLLAQFEDFHGWDLHAAWDDTRFGIKHYADFDRIAFVGERKWEEWMVRLCKPFTRADIRYFDAGDTDAAWAWLKASP